MTEHVCPCMLLHTAQVFLVALCGTIEELAKVELEPVQAFVCDIADRLCALPLSRNRVSDCGVLELLPRLAKTNSKRLGSSACCEYCSI